MATITGDNGSETLSGATEDADILESLGGSDVINALGGADVISAGDGADTVFGGEGDDIIYGQSSADLSQGSSHIRATKLASIGSGAVQTAITDADPGFVYALAKDKGVVYRINEETGKKTEFLDIPDNQFAAGGERGVLGMAFHPDYAENGRFFIYMNRPDGDVEVREYGPANNNPDRIVFKQTILTVEHSEFGNHNGGSIVFGPDGMLYLGLGDGGGGGDPGQNAQDLDSLLGKILRINVDGTSDGNNYAIPQDNPYASGGGAPEIWASGIRNPWRMSFDPATGDLYIGDVGQNTFEEINYIAADTLGGLNFGWNYREGFEDYDGDNEPGDAPGGLTFTDPVFTYSHEGGSASVTGGVVYHGPAPGLQGAYVFSDFITGKVYTLRMVDGVAEDAAERSGQIKGAELSNIAAFGTDSDGNLLAVSLGGDIYRLKPGAAAGDGDDQLHGGAGNDSLYGGFGNDQLFGDSDDDRLEGGLGKDMLEGGTGADTFVFRTGAGKDVVTDFEFSGNAHDLVDLTRLDGIDSFRDLKRHHLSTVDGDVVIRVGTDQLTLEDISVSELGRSHFEIA